MARCAVCLVHLSKGDQFSLVDEFVVHRRCQGGVIQIHQKSVHLEREAARHAAKYLEQSQRLHDLHGELHRRADRQEDYLQLLVQIRDAKEAIAALESQLASERNLRALAELESRSTRVAPAITPAPNPEQIPAVEKSEGNEPEDGTAVRFSLLELT